MNSEIKLKPCPFCGGEANIVRYGNAKMSTQYECKDCSCSLETNEEWNHGNVWNQRVKIEEVDSTDNCYLDYGEDGELICTYNHEAGEECLTDMCKYCNKIKCECYD